MLEQLGKIDGEILLWIQEHVRNIYLTPFMVVITTMGNAAAVWCLIAIVLLCRKERRRVGIMMVVAMLTSFFINNLLLKNIVARTRPYERIAELHLLVGKAVDLSFPSGHSASSFAAAMVLCLAMPKRYGIPAMILATSIALSRLYVGIHYPFDVAFGIVSGSVIGYMSFMVLDKKLTQENTSTAN